jgi:glycosyltransferase involved in cell wall biosynthesis
VTRRALLVSKANPYPVVKDGCQRLVRDYADGMFSSHEVHFLHVSRDWTPLGLFLHGLEIDPLAKIDRLLALDFEFAVFIGFALSDFTSRLTSCVPSFCYMDSYPSANIPSGLFRGILSHRMTPGGGDDEVLLVGGSYDGDVFHRERAGEEIVLSVGRIHPTKNQLELVSRYRETIFEPYGLPLYLAGGASDPAYFEAVAPYIDGVAVRSSVVDPIDPSADANWHTALELAELSNRARLFISASPKESFGMAMIEAIACGATCVINGDYWGFAQSDLRPNVHGNLAGKKGSVLDLAARALRDDVRIDGSDWAPKYSLRAMRETVSRFVDDRA